MAIYSNSFDKVYSDLLSELGVSNYKVGEFSHIDEGYLSNLKNGLKNNPSPEIVVRIGLALVHCSDKVRMHHVEKLFNATGRSLFTHKS